MMVQIVFGYLFELIRNPYKFKQIFQPTNILSCRYPFF